MIHERTRELKEPEKPKAKQKKKRKKKKEKENGKKPGRKAKLPRLSLRRYVLSRITFEELDPEWLKEMWTVTVICTTT
jgi:hypothetical protein